MKPPDTGTVAVGGATVEVRTIASKTGKHLRLRVGPRGVELVRPTGKTDGEVAAFLDANSRWLADQIERVERMRGMRRPERHLQGALLFRGEPVPVCVERVPGWRAGNRVELREGQIVVRCGETSPTSPARTLEKWLRERAREAFAQHLAKVLPRLRRTPGKVLVMGQRTKWGNCSALGNLSYNWRLVLAPPAVVRYLVTHEAVHLAVPDHSAKFWLTVQSLCPETERAKQWLAANGQRLLVDLADVLA